MEHTLDLARTFRQSPSSEYARAAANSLRESISINERPQSAYARRHTGPFDAQTLIRALEETAPVRQ